MKLQHLRAILLLTSSTEDGRPDYTDILETYDVLINLLSCLKAPEQWLVGEVLFVDDEAVGGGTKKPRPYARQVDFGTTHRGAGVAVAQVAVRIDDLRAEYKEYVEKQEQFEMPQLITLA